MSDPVCLPHPDKPLFPEIGVTKSQVARYYERVGATILPYLMQRPITLHHFPKGVGEPGYFRKHIPEHYPGHIERVAVPHKDASDDEVIMVGVDDLDDLVYLVGQNNIELHVTTARLDSLNTPDQIVFDIDPDGHAFGTVRIVALALKDLLDELGATPFVKLSGKTGLHVHVPIEPAIDYDELQPWIHRIADRLAEAHPTVVTTAQRRAQRGGKIYIDIMRNHYAQTVVAPYSLRATAVASIAAPIGWHELARAQVHPSYVTIKNLHRRMSHVRDPWAEFDRRRLPAKNLAHQLSRL